MMRRLAPCPESPNCVSSQTSDRAKRMPPLRYQGPLEEARAAILENLGKRRGVRLVVSESEYIHAEFTTRWFRFADDVEFVIDPGEKRIHFRSASRVGHWDLGANRRRMASICRALTASGKIFFAEP